MKSSLVILVVCFFICGCHSVREYNVTVYHLEYDEKSEHGDSAFSTIMRADKAKEIVESSKCKILYFRKIKVEEGVPHIDDHKYDITYPNGEDDRIGRRMLCEVNYKEEGVYDLTYEFEHEILTDWKVASFEEGSVWPSVRNDSITVTLPISDGNYALLGSAIEGDRQFYRLLSVREHRGQEKLSSQAD